MEVSENEVMFHNIVKTVKGFQVSSILSYNGIKAFKY